MILWAVESEPALCWGGNDLNVERHSKSTIVAAGKVLAGKPQYNDETIRAFSVAHDWRSSHVLPMRSMRAELSRLVRRLPEDGLTAARLKRMKSIRKKLTKGPLSLVQIQDIAGCRAIVESMSGVRSLQQTYNALGRRFELLRSYDYIEEPRATGYRSLHLVFKYNGRDPEGLYDRQRIELQVRTALQHAWATAVEAVGLILDQDMKGGQGDAKWLRLFELVSSEFAAEKRQPCGANVSGDTRIRRSEIRELNADLSALENLSRWNDSIKYTERFAAGVDNRFFLIQYNPETHQLIIQPFAEYSQSYRKYVLEEGAINSNNTVLVEVDRISDLRAAYPNYFLDVRFFTEKLERIINPRRLHQSVVPPVRPKPLRIDLRGTKWEA